MLRCVTFWLILMLAWAAPLGAETKKGAKVAREGKAKLSADDDGDSEGVVNKLLAPGPLMLAHKSLEHGECLKCHDAGKGVPDGKCLTCHTEIDKSIRRGKTFHGLTKAPCLSCHSDHKGRDLNSTAVNLKTFNHAKTGFDLHGAHAKIKCAKCHTEKRGQTMSRPDDRRFFGKTETCMGCHKKDDIHFFPPKWAAKDCGSCHAESTWKGGKFNHSKETTYPLVGDHAKISCASCHLPKGKTGPAKYAFPELPQKQCLSCHVDFHKDNLEAKFRGGNCLKCHNQDSWKIKNFDHEITGFSLKGKHQTTPCIDCHKAKGGAKTELKHVDFTGLKTDCASCHKDYHGFRGESSPQLGPLAMCKTCHTEAGWKADLKFNHNTETKYQVDGKHVGVKCFACHVPLHKGQHAPETARKYSFPDLATKTCESCHTSPHKTESASVFRTSKCSTCHSTQGWKILNTKGGAGFNHDTMTRFALTGDHTRISCNSCHVKGGQSVYKFPNEDKKFCVSCHASVHKAQFEPKLAEAACSNCHDTSHFRDIHFNHNDSRFKLTGAHEVIGNDCIKCHKPTTATLPTRPPKPAGKFVFEHPDGGFCVDCHKNIHKDQFRPPTASDNCLQCHNVKSFKDLKTFDHSKTRFKIVDAHVPLACDKCHVKTTKMLDLVPPRPAGKFRFETAQGDSGPGGFCLSCHKNIHIGQFKDEFTRQSCTTCHTQKNFTSRLAFDHNSTEFKIVGAHAKFADNCRECHTKTSKMLATTPPKPASLFLFQHAATGYCESCHAPEHLSQFHPNFAGQACVSCHNQDQFAQGIKFDHHRTRFDVKNKHLDVKCAKCHTPTKAVYKQSPHHQKGKFIFEVLLTKDCALCHKDPHAGRFGPKCSTCHTDAGWEASASFHKDFILSGVHNLLDCAQCHVDNRTLTGLGDDCKMCHQKDDIHLGTQSDCKSCHNQQFWSAPKFQHSLTNFPLRGAHRLMQCGECHAQGVYQGKSTECISCHMEDAMTVTFPNHKLAGFQQCDSCHNQFQFKSKN